MFWFWFKKNWNPRSGSALVLEKNQFRLQFWISDAVSVWVTQSETHGQPSVPDICPPDFYLFIYLVFSIPVPEPAGPGLVPELDLE